MIIYFFQCQRYLTYLIPLTTNVPGGTVRLRQQVGVFRQDRGPYPYSFKPRWHRLSVKLSPDAWEVYLVGLQNHDMFFTRTHRGGTSGESKNWCWGKRRYIRLFIKSQQLESGLHSRTKWTNKITEWSKNIMFEWIPGIVHGGGVLGDVTTLASPRSESSPRPESWLSLLFISSSFKFKLALTSWTVVVTMSISGGGRRVLSKGSKSSTEVFVAGR